MGEKSSANSSINEKPASNTWRLVVTGYSMLAVALAVFLTINGASGIPSAAPIVTAGLMLIGFLLSAVGMLKLRSAISSIRNAGRYGFALQVFGLLSLLIGVVLVVAVSSLSGYLLSAIFVVLAGVFAISGAVLLHRYFASNVKGAIFLVFGTALIYSGVALIVASNIAFEYLISQVQNTIYVDIGATISACGCILSAYSFFVIHNRS